MIRETRYYHTEAQARLAAKYFEGSYGLSHGGRATVFYAPHCNLWAVDTERYHTCD